MNTRDAKSLARAKMKEHGLLQTGWTLQFDNAKIRFGFCQHGTKLISLSEPLTLLNRKQQVLDVILHEIAHALAGLGEGHSYAWKKKCIEIGARPERCYSSDVIQPKNARLERKWRGECPNGHRTQPRARRVKISCGRCSRRFNPEYMFEWKLINEGV